jgi:hypothetical protein
MVELSKMIFSIVLLFDEYTVGMLRAASEASAIPETSLRVERQDFFWFGATAVAYALFNILVYCSIGSSDLGTFGILREMVILWTALMWKTVFGGVLGSTRLGGISLIVIGSMLAMRTVPTIHSLGQLKPFGLVLAMTLSNAGASVVNEFAMKANLALNINMQNLILYSCGVAFFAGFLALTSPKDLSPWHFFNGFTVVTWATIALQASTGLVISRIFKYTDAMYKCAAAALRAPLLCCLGPVILRNGQGHPPPLTIFASILTAIGCCAYLSQGRIQQLAKDALPKQGHKAVL